MESKEINDLAEEYLKIEKNEEFRREIIDLIAQKKDEELYDRFYKDLYFGTGGIRGIIGGGFNRINTYMIKKSTRGFAEYINQNVAPDNKKVVIAYDSRNYSDIFAKEAALVLCENAIKVFLFTSLRPTPELSYAVRKLNAAGGIVITASHNPKEYNGYKVYWSDGGQIVPPHDDGIIEEVRKIKGLVKGMSEKEAVDKGLLNYIDREIDESYLKAVEDKIIRNDIIDKYKNEIKIVYTPLHGTGLMPVKNVLDKLGIKIFVVPEQEKPDKNFSTVKYPNPEEASAMEKALALGKKVNADIVMGTDPDADRLGIAVPDGNKYRLITGNQLGALLADYILMSLKEKNKLPRKPVIVKTIVTTELQRLIAGKYNTKVYDVLTGFKYIASKIKEFERTGEDYIFGGEESYGYLIGTDVRDKDAVSAAVLTIEMAMYNRSLGRTVIDYLNELYKEHGYFEEILINKYLKGSEGNEKIKEIMKWLRETPPVRFGSSRVKILKDYLYGKIVDTASGKTTAKIDLPESNVLQFILEDETVVSARPSGTEPKIKFYASCRSREEIKIAKKEVSVKLEEIRKTIEKIIADFT